MLVSNMSASATAARRDLLSCFSPVESYRTDRRRPQLPRYRRILRDLYGWGAPLIVQSSGGSSSVLVDSVEDYGLGRFLPSLFGRPTGAWISWRSPVPPSNEHRILVWSDILQEPQVIGTAAILSQQNGATWKLPSLASIAAVAITYQGTRITSYWTPQAALRKALNCLI